MPIHERKDTRGYYFQWGNRGKKYYYTLDSKSSRTRAYNKAFKQMKAAYANGY